MQQMKICFIGIGSIANRHINNLRLIGSQRNIKFTIDAYRRSPCINEGVDHVYTNENDLPSDYDIIFITNPTELHLDSLHKFHDKGNHFFIEKPVVSVNQLEKAKQIALRQESVYYVACPLRYNAVIQFIKNNIDLSEVISVRSISSSYLPDWRPGKDYRDTYSAHKSMGGGVSIDLIHEWDYLTYLFGMPEQVMSFIGKKSSLKIDSDDIAVYIGEYNNKIVELHLDYFGRKTIREIQLFTNHDTIVGDLVRNKINYLVSQEEIDFHEERDDYQKREINHFLNMVLGTEKKEDGYYHGLEILLLTQGIN